MIVAKIIDSPRGVFKLPAIELTSKRRDLLAGFCLDDIINIVGIAAMEKDPSVIESRHIPYKFYTLIAMLFGISLVVTNILSSKLISVFGITITGGAIAYTMTYIFGDIVTEIYGYKRSRQLIWGTVFCNLFSMFFIYLSIIIPPSPFWHNQQAYAEVLGAIPRVELASLISYCCGEFINSYVISKMKIAYNGHYLFLRIFSSSAIAITINSPIFCLLAFFGKLPTHELICLGLKIYAFNMIYEFLALPFTCWVIRHIKRMEQLDIVDLETKFTPFSMESTYNSSNNHWGRRLDI